MTSIHTTAIVIVATLASAMATQICSAEEVQIGANLNVESLSAPSVNNDGLALTSGLAPLAASDLTYGQLLTAVQLQPTKLKKVSTKKAIIITAVVVAAVVVVTYVIAVRKFYLCPCSWRATTRVSDPAEMSAASPAVR